MKQVFYFNTFQIFIYTVSQTPTGSIIINESTGDIYVGNASAFDYKQNNQIVAIISVSDGTSTTESTLTINILDVINEYN